MRFARVSIAISVASLAASLAWAEPAPKPEAAKPPADVATLLFGNPQWDKAPVGDTITYSYAKKTGRPIFGPSFDDHITLKLAPGDDAASRTVEVKMFTGPHAKPAGPFNSVQQNPVLLLAMEENVQELSQLFKANPRYLKNAIRKAWRDDAKIVDTQVDVAGKSVPGTRITVTPFANDPEKDKMMGLEGLTYTVDIAASVPGDIAAIDIRTPTQGGQPIFSETLKYQSEAK